MLVRIYNTIKGLFSPGNGNWKVRRHGVCKFRDPHCTGPGILSCRCGKGGDGATTVVQSSPASSGTSAEAVNAWVNSLPQVYETQMKYAPQEAAQQVQMAQQFALPLAQAFQTANEVLNPKTSSLQETMANQALTGMTATAMPDWMAKQYRDEYKANLGSNVSSPIGADYISRGMQQQLFNQQQKYRDLGLSLAGRQPLSVATAPATTNYASTFTPSNVMNYLGSMGTKTSTTSGGGGGGLFGGLFG